MLLAFNNKNMSLAQMKRLELIKEGNDQKQIRMIGKSLFIFSDKNWLRRLFYVIVKHKFYDNLVLFFIAISTIMLGLDNPNKDPNGDYA